MATITEDKTEVTEALAKLHAAVEEIHNSDEWAEWLTFMSRLHNYSPLNRLWMWCQWEGRREVQAFCNVATAGAIPPLPAFSLPAAFSFWKDKGRMVRKGEKALTVLAPIVVKDKETDRSKCIGFRLKSRTFDVSQTEGDAIPSNPVRCDEIAGAGDSVLFDALASIATLNGWIVSDEMPRFLAAEMDCNGVCVFSTKTLHVRSTMSGAQRLRTLIHEIAHSLMHTPEQYNLAHAGARNAAEIEAESVAYVVASNLGIDSSAYSICYVASWAKGNGAAVAKSAERVLETAERVLAALETGTLAPAKVRDAKTEEVAA